MDFDFEFSGDDKVTGGSIPANTIVTVSAVPHTRHDPERGEKLTENGLIKMGVAPRVKKTYLGITMRVVAPEEFAGKRVDTSLWVEKDSAKFRTQVEMVTGIQIPKPGDTDAPKVKMNPEVISEHLAENSYIVKVGPDNKGYTEVKYWNERVDHIDPPVEEIKSPAEGEGQFAAGWDNDDDDDDF